MQLSHRLNKRFGLPPALTMNQVGVGPALGAAAPGGIWSVKLLCWPTVEEGVQAGIHAEQSSATRHQLPAAGPLTCSETCRA